MDQLDETIVKNFIVNAMKENYSNEEYWQEILYKMDFSDPNTENFILDNIELFNIDYLLQYSSNLTNKIIDTILENIDLFDINNLLKYHILTIKQIEYLIETIGKENINWSLLQEYQNLNSDFIEKYKDFIDWDLISENQFMELKFLLLNKNKLNWALIASNIKMQQIICPSFLTFFKDTNIWDRIAFAENIDIKTILDNSEFLTSKSIKLILEYRDLDEESIKQLKQLC
jgi:hypothetical protein